FERTENARKKLEDVRSRSLSSLEKIINYMSIYIRFSVNTNSNLNLSLVQKITKGILSAILPKANPDFDSKIDSVSTWLVELPDADSTPSREIGLDTENNIIVEMPDDRNYGYWVDNNWKLD